MTDDADAATTDTLAATLATTDHEDVPATTVERFDGFLSTVDAALDDGNASRAADALAAFWRAYLTASLDADGTAAPATLADDALQAAVVGIDLYQALDRFFAERNADEPDALADWTGRLADLTAAQYDHLRDHHR